MNKLRSVKVVTVSVDYHAELRLALSANLKVFKDRYLVVTTFDDIETVKICQEFGVEVKQTHSFHENGAVFNKWKGLEEGLDEIGRTGWIAILDSDIVFPLGAEIDLCPGKFYTPERKILEDFSQGIPQEVCWCDLPGVGHYEGFPGYCQIFRGEDAPLEKPWHRIDLGHAGCADTWFEEKWPKMSHLHPNFFVIHLGKPFQNWVGRRLTEEDRVKYLKRAYKGRAIFL